jgi:hypothetical protein
MKNIRIGIALVGLLGILYFVSFGISKDFNLTDAYSCRKVSDSDKEHCSSTAVADFVDGEYDQCIKCWTRQTSDYHKDVVDEKELARWKFYFTHTEKTQMADKTTTQLSNNLLIYLWSPLIIMIVIIGLMWLVYQIATAKEVSLVDDDFYSQRGPRGGQYRMSASGKSKVYITRN